MNTTIHVAAGAATVNVTSRGFSKPRNAIHWSNVYCNGRENTLSMCRVFTHSLDDGIQLRSRLNVAGVSCQSSTTGSVAETANMIGRVASSNVATTVFAAFSCAFLFAIL